MRPRNSDDEESPSARENARREAEYEQYGHNFQNKEPKTTMERDSMNHAIREKHEKKMREGKSVYEEMHEKARKEKQARKHGEGHDMAKHGEGKPYGGSK